jgi:aldose 1-epimerase
MSQVRASHAEFGALFDGTSVAAVELSNSTGMSVHVIALGAAIQSLQVPDREGRSADVVLGFASAQQYLAHTQYFGATVGRYANRIANGRFALDGRTFALDQNEGSHHLHGGFRGLDKALWRIGSVTSGAEARAVLTHLDADGSGGYPGELQVTATYTLDVHNQLTIEYRAVTTKPTIVNLTHHGYFNLAGEGSGHDIMDHMLTIAAEQYTPVDENSIPTGEIRDVAHTALDFRAPHAIAERIRDGREPQLRIGRGYDHNFVVAGEPGTLRGAARLEHPGSGRALELFATAPGLQFYSGNFLDGTILGKTGRLYRQGDGLCLEPQFYPDSPNRPEFPSARLEPGEEYVTTTKLRFSTV